MSTQTDSRSGQSSSSQTSAFQSEHDCVGQEKMTLQEPGGDRIGRAWSSLVVSLETREAFIAASMAQDVQ